MSGKSPRLGSAEKAALTALLVDEGVWTPSSRWRYDTLFWTLTVLKKLERKGYVREVAADEHYELTPAGVAKAEEVEVTISPSLHPQQQWPVDLPEQVGYGAPQVMRLPRGH